MRRENKLALIIGFSLLLVVAVLVSDHLSQARQDDVGDGLRLLSELPDDGILVRTPLNEADRDPAGGAAGPVGFEDAPRPLLTPRNREGVPDRRAEAAAEKVEGLEVAPLTTARPDEPVILANGPAAAEGEADGGNTLAEILDFPRNKIRALLEVDRGRKNESPRRAPEPGAGQIRSAGVYVVQEGDTLYEICQRLYGDGEKWREMAEFNEGRVGEDGQVYAGVTLKLLPGVRSTQASQARGQSEASGVRVYTVRKGDTLSEIAQREAGSIRFLDRIRELNPSLRDGKDRIFVGQKLKLPTRGG